MAERYKLQVGRWGMYVHDTETGQDIDMEQERDANSYAELFRDLSFGVAACCFAAVVLIEVLK